jgi:hypothetical protein
MGYSIRDTETGDVLPVCLTARWYDGDNDGWAVPSFVPDDWRCEPSSISARYEVTASTGCVSTYGWWELIIIGYDDLRDIEIKLAHWRKVQAAQDALSAAQRAYNELTR